MASHVVNILRSGHNAFWSENNNIGQVRKILALGFSILGIDFLMTTARID